MAPHRPSTTRRRHFHNSIPQRSQAQARTSRHPSTQSSSLRCQRRPSNTRCKSHATTATTSPRRPPLATPPPRRPSPPHILTPIQSLLNPIHAPLPSHPLHSLPTPLNPHERTNQPARKPLLQHPPPRRRRAHHSHGLPPPRLPSSHTRGFPTCCEAAFSLELRVHAARCFSGRAFW